MGGKGPIQCPFLQAPHTTFMHSAPQEAPFENHLSLGTPPPLDSFIQRVAAAAAAAKLLQSCPTLRPHRRQPTRLLRPWDFAGKSIQSYTVLNPPCLHLLWMFSI